MKSDPVISAIVPAWCEAALIADAVTCARAVADEVIVADAGSPDGTAEVARAAGAKVVQAPKGRGAQLRAGADAAAGQILLFLHADARLAPSAREAILACLGDDTVGGGNFRVAFLPRGAWVCRFFSWANHLRRVGWRTYYGDSGIFVRRAVYQQLGGFRPDPIFEDFEFVRRLERYCRTAYLDRETIWVSGRRFLDRPWRTVMLWAWLTCVGHQVSPLSAWRPPTTTAGTNAGLALPDWASRLVCRAGPT